jgi:hypothetical protein
MQGIGLVHVGARARGDRLDTLTLAVGQEPQGVGREIRAPAGVAENLSDAVEVPHQALLRRFVEEKVHAPSDHGSPAPGKFLDGESSK